MEFGRWIFLERISFFSFRRIACHFVCKNSNLEMKPKKAKFFHFLFCFDLFDRDEAKQFDFHILSLLEQLNNNNLQTNNVNKLVKVCIEKASSLKSLDTKDPKYFVFSFKKICLTFSFSLLFCSSSSFMFVF